MKLRRFILKIVLLITLLIGFYLSFSYLIADKFVDRYYNKFRYETGSMVIGLSRSNFGISPKVLKDEFREKEIAKPILNFSFELYQSPYGLVYKNAIEKKIKKGTKNGLFILSVSPGSFLIPINAQDENIEKQEEGLVLDRMKFLNVDPNFEYMAKCYSNPLYKGLMYWPYDEIVITHENGWVEFTHGNSTTEITEAMVNKWEKETLVSYKKILDNQKISNSRLNSFAATIEMLKKYGNVYIIRMPVLQEVLDFENEFWPEMNHLMDSISKKTRAPYWDYTKDHKSYTYYDGSHLFSKSAEKFTEQLSKDIKKTSY